MLLGVRMKINMPAIVARHNHMVRTKCSPPCEACVEMGRIRSNIEANETTFATSVHDVPRIDLLHGVSVSPR
jgi:hypothetical protein